MNATTANDNAATEIEMGETRDVGAYRIHRGALSLRVTEIAHAGKRGKRCPVVVLYQPCARSSEADIATATASVHRLVQLGAQWVAVVAHVRSLARGGLAVEEREERGVDVEPPCVQVEIRTDTIDVTASAHRFSARRPGTADCDSVYTRSRADGAKMHAWAIANRARLGSMRVFEIEREARAMGVNLGYYCGD